MDQNLKEDALNFHLYPTPGKLSVVATKPLATQRDLSLAYSPGVAAACLAIAEEEQDAYKYTAKANLVAVVTNGTAVLGLGDIGPLASKPVMEGKSVLFKKFAGIDSFDIEVDEKDPVKLATIVRSLEPTFGAINLEDIKAPDCFVVEKILRQQMNIPVFHDDQHGTAIIVCAAILNGLYLVNKKIEDVKLVTSGAGAAALACLDLLISLGLKRENIIATDIEGVVYKGREVLMDEWKAQFAADTQARSLKDAIKDANIFMGLSAGNVLKPDMLELMAAEPLVLALANPTPEIDPKLAKETRDDVIVATGRSDFPNQVNNVLCFPFIFRGALDVGATTINEDMKKACVRALAELARKTAPDTLTSVYSNESLSFGKEYLIPKPFDHRLAVEIPLAVAHAAMASGVASRPIKNFDRYQDQLSQRVVRSGLLMKPVFDYVKDKERRIVFSDGEEERVLRAVKTAVDERLARPILIGRPEVLDLRIKRLGIDLKEGRDYEICNPDNDPRYKDYTAHYLNIMGRNGVTPEIAREIVRTRRSVIASIMLDRGEADAMIAGPVGNFSSHLRHIVDVIGLKDDMVEASTIHALVIDSGTIFMADTSVSIDPTAEEIAKTTVHACAILEKFGITPKVALINHSNFGSSSTGSSKKMCEALRILNEIKPDLEVDGEMQVDAALSEKRRQVLLPQSRLKGRANLLIMPDLNSASIGYNLIRSVTGAVSVGPMLIGPKKPCHIVTNSISTRGLLNMTALAAVDSLGVG